MSMNKFFGAPLLAAALVVTGFSAADAQNQLDRNQIINSLAGTARTVGRFDPIALEQAAARAAASGGEDAASQLTDALASLPQLSVQINFDLNSGVIEPDSYYAVGLIADAMHTPSLSGQRFAVIGHTDASGPREFNFKLSQKRARAVAEALMTTFNVPVEELIAIGLGEEQLQDPANPRSAVNRRVQIINIGQ